MSTTLTVALLGAFHGLNPAMGWLFAVGLGLQEGRRAGVLRALPPIALGHALSIGAVLAAVSALRLVVPPRALALAAAAVLLGFGGYVLVRRSVRHPRWVGMRVGFRDLTLWSFLMSSAHGAGLMLVPVLLAIPAAAAAGAHVGHAAQLASTAGAIGGATALGVHTLALFAVMAGVAIAVFEILGLALLRRAWINLDVIWGGAMVVAGVVTGVRA
ncbi:MAG TPA: hypothetical protein VKA84_20335 [Gemmatimonadaceae bacterium]|nr:hypothetical protein [Gemmatimonadaceae bacterium]